MLSQISSGLEQTENAFKSKSLDHYGNDIIHVIIIIPVPIVQEGSSLAFGRTSRDGLSTETIGVPVKFRFRPKQSIA
jgi:hypothetical protein